MNAASVIAIILICGGVFFLTVSAIGLLRLPDFYARTHAVGKSETLGSMLVLAGLAVYQGWHINTLRLLLIMAFVMIANPTATHAIAQTAMHAGLQPWTQQTRGKKRQEADFNHKDTTDSTEGDGKP